MPYRGPRRGSGLVVKNRTQLTLQALRKRSNLSQNALAAKSQIPRSIIVESEGGKRDLTSEVAMKAAPVLGVDAVRLLIEHNTAAIKRRIDAGTEGPTKAANLARMLVQLLEEGSMNQSQRMAARAAVKELLDILEEHAGTKGTVDVATKSGTATAEEDMDLFLHRDTAGRPISEREANQRREDRAAGVWDRVGEDDPEWDADGPQTDQGSLGRDKWGRVV